MLLSKKREREQQARAAEIQYGALKERIDTIKATRKEFQGAQATLEQLRGDLPLRTWEVEEHEKEAAHAKSHLEDVRKGHLAVEKVREEAELARHYLDTKKETEEIRLRLQRIAEAAKVFEQCKKECTVLVAPDARALRAIRKVSKERDEAQIRLEAALITLEIVPEKAGSLEIVVGERTGSRALTPGRPTEVKGSPEVVVDVRGIGRLRAWGPSSSAEELRTERDQALRKLNELTRSFGAVHLEELEALSEKARELDKKIAEAETQLVTLLAEESIEKLEQKRAKALIVLDGILAVHSEWKKVAPNIANLIASAQESRRTFIAAVESAEVTWEAAHSALTAARTQKATLDVKLEEADKRVKSLGARIADLTADDRTNEERETELNKLALSWDAAKATLKEVEEKLQEFDEDPRTATTKLDKQLQGAEETATKALEAEKIEEGKLAHLAAQGPYSALAQAEEEVTALKEEVTREELRTSAVRLLYDTVTQCRTEALGTVLVPVQLAASRTLQRIAGGRLGNIQLGETFEPAHVLPQSAETSIPLDNVSGGEREQIYLATRLALAEVLAKEERQLVVLDDVLTATDAGRLARILTILEEAAQRLQILIITCHPERYRGLDDACFFDLELILHDAANI